MTVVVVGGGVAGLVAARVLALGGESVILLEASQRLGGTVASQRVGGLVLDAGAEGFATRRGAVAALAADLGLEVVEPVQSPWLCSEDGSAHPVPATSLLGIPGVAVASDVIAIIGWRAALRALLDDFMPAAVGAKSATLADLVRSRMGRAVLDQLVAPVVAGVHSRQPGDLDLDRIAPGLRAAVRSEGSLARAVRSMQGGVQTVAINGISGGVHRLGAALEAELERLGVDVRRGARVTAIDPGGVIVDGARVEGRVLVAAPHLLGDYGADEVLAAATLVVDCPALDSAPRGTELLVAGSGTPRTLTHATAKWPWLARQLPAGRHIIRLSYSAAPDSQQAVADAERLLGVRFDRVVDVAAVEWRRPQPQGAAPDGVWVTGQATSGTGLAAVVRHASETAEAVLAAR